MALSQCGLIFMGQVKNKCGWQETESQVEIPCGPWRSLSNHWYMFVVGVEHQGICPLIPVPVPLSWSRFLTLSHFPFFWSCPQAPCLSFFNCKLGSSYSWSWSLRALLGVDSFNFPHSGSVLSTSWAVGDSSATQPGRQPMAGGQTSEEWLRCTDPDSVSICHTVSSTKSFSLSFWWAEMLSVWASLSKLQSCLEPESDKDTHSLAKRLVGGRRSELGGAPPCPSLTS